MNKIIYTLFLLAIHAGTVRAQEQKIKGTVTDTDGLAIVGATLLEKGTQNFTTTDFNGDFELTAEQRLPITLIISAFGFKQQTTEFYEVNEESLTIVLKPENSLSQVIVTA
jgi:hypothetical protein